MLDSVESRGSGRLPAEFLGQSQSRTRAPRPPSHQISSRLSAPWSLLHGLASTPTRRGPTFVCARHRGLRSMSGHPAYAWGNPPTLRRSSFSQRASRPAGAPYQNTLGAVPQDPLTLKLRLDTNDALASSVQRRRYALKVPATHFYVEIVDRVPLPRCGGGGRGKGQMRLRLPLERICAQYGFGFFG